VSINYITDVRHEANAGYKKWRVSWIVGEKWRRDMTGKSATNLHVGVAEPSGNESWLKPGIVGSDFLPLQTPKLLLYSVTPPWSLYCWRWTELFIVWV